VQLSIASGDLTTTSVDFSYFLNTREHKSLCFGPGLLEDVAFGTPVEFMIQARNDHGENRTSGRDVFAVKVKKIKSKVEVVEVVEEADENAEAADPADESPAKKAAPVVEESVECEIIDNNDGTYNVKYQVEEECEVEIDIQFQNEESKMVPVRGSPYRASFVANAKPNDNTMNGGAMDRFIKRELDQIQKNLTDEKKQINTKDKDLKDVKVLLGVKETVDNINKNEKKITL